MFLTIKELKEHLDIKCLIFSERLPKKMRSFWQIIEEMKESIWQQLYREQGRLIDISRDD
jgi:hypothetical protein